MFSLGVCGITRCISRTKSKLPQTTFSHPRKMENYKGNFCHLFYFDYYLNVGPLEPWRDHHLSPASQQYTNCTPFPLISRYFSTMDPIITSVTEQDPVVNEEALIDQDKMFFMSKSLFLLSLCPEATCPIN
jgi:hypothetical protein